MADARSRFMLVVVVYLVLLQTWALGSWQGGRASVLRRQY
jgi:hypothetical protein